MSDYDKKPEEGSVSNENEGSEEFECNYEPLDENEKEVKNFQVNYEPLNEPGNPDWDYYPTLNFITDIQSEISKLVPVNDLHGGRISYDKLSEYLGMHKRYIRDTRSRIQNSKSTKYNPDFKFSKSQLESFLNSLSQGIKDVDLKRIIKIFSKYCKS